MTWSLADDSTENGIAWPGWNRLEVQAHMEGKWRKHSPWACGPWLAFIAADVAWPGVTSPQAGEAINTAPQTWGGLTNTSWTNSKANYPLPESACIAITSSQIHSSLGHSSHIFATCLSQTQLCNVNLLQAPTQSGVAHKSKPSCLFCESSSGIGIMRSGSVVNMPWCSLSWGQRPAKGHDCTDD